MRLKNKTNTEVKFGWSGHTIVVPPRDGPERGSIDAPDALAPALKLGEYQKFRQHILVGDEAARADALDEEGHALVVREKLLEINEAEVALEERRLDLDRREAELREREERVAALIVPGTNDEGPVGRE